MEFQREQRVVFALAGTVAIPSPFPAHARISMGVFPRPQDCHSDTYTYQYYLKLTQSCGDREVETRVVRLEDLRAVRSCVRECHYYGPEDWTLRTADDLCAVLAEKKAALLQMAATPGVEPEIELDPRAILYVPSDAPVLVRTEYGTTAGQCGPGGPHLPGSTYCPGSHPGARRSAFMDDGDCPGSPPPPPLPPPRAW